MLEVTPAAREVANAILRPRRLPLPLRPAFDALNLATVGLLPPTRGVGIATRPVPETARR